MGYTDVFGGNAVKPAEISYNALSLTSTPTQLSWPSEGVAPEVSAILEITTDASSYEVKMPDARKVSPGETATFKNTGSNTFFVVDYDGGAVATVAPGVTVQVYLRSNSSAAGTWGAWTLGASSSSADASALDGNGLEAYAGLLRTKHTVTELAVTSAITEAHRDNVVVWTGGAGSFNLSAAASLSNGWQAVIKNNGSGTLTIQSSGGDTFDGASSLTVSPGNGYIIACEGTKFISAPLYNPSTPTFTIQSVNAAGTGNYTLSTSEAANQALKFTGILTGNRTIIVPTTIKEYWINNATTGAFTLTVKTLAGSGIAVTQTKQAILYCDGTDVIAAETDEGAGISTPVAIANGGTGATTAGAALTNLGGTATGVSVFTAANAAAALSAIGGVGLASANTFTNLNYFTYNDAVTNTVTEIMRLQHTSSGTVVANFGLRTGYYLENGSGSTVNIGYQDVQLTTVTAGAEVSKITFGTIQAGTLAARVAIGNGIYGNGTTGGDKGADTANFTTIYEANTSLASKYAAIASANTFSALQTISIADAVTNTITDVLSLRHTTSGTAAANFGVGLKYVLENASNTNKDVASIDAYYTDATNASEDVVLSFKTMIAGVAKAEKMYLGNGLVVGSPTGGDKGAGTVNATLYDGGTLVTEKIATITENAQTGTTYTLVLADAGKMVTCSNAAAITLTVPANATVAFPIGTRIDVTQIGAGQITFTPDSGVTINCAGSKNKTTQTYSGATLWKQGTNIWYLYGDLTV